MVDNCNIAEEVFTEINHYNRDAIILCVTNPLDVVTMKIHQVTGRAARKVIGSGTPHDTARLVRAVAELLEVSDRQIYIPVVGEHGASAVSLLSHFRIMGMSMDDYMKSVTDTDAILNVKALENIFKKSPSAFLTGRDIPAQVFLMRCVDSLPAMLPIAGKSCRFLLSCRVKTGFRALRLLSFLSSAETELKTSMKS